jgi:hypothetical protein
MPKTVRGLAVVNPPVAASDGVLVFRELLTCILRRKGPAHTKGQKPADG